MAAYLQIDRDNPGFLRKPMFPQKTQLFSQKTQVSSENPAFLSENSYFLSGNPSFLSENFSKTQVFSRKPGFSQKNLGCSVDLNYLERYPGFSLKK